MPSICLTKHNMRQQVVIVLACTMLTFTACGLNFAFGIWQEYYESAGPPFQDASPGDINLIGILAGSIMMLGGPVASHLTQQTSPRFVAALGAICFLAANIGASLGTRLVHFQISQGLLQGIAACLAYIPAVTLPPYYVQSRRGLVTGIVLSGTGLGGVLWAPILQAMMAAVGFRAALVVTGIVGGLLILASALWIGDTALPKLDSDGTHSRKAPRSITAAVAQRLAGFHSKAFTAHAIGTAFQAAAYFLPIHFVPSLARSLGYSRHTESNIVAFSNFCNFAGKIFFGFVADHLGKINSLALVTGLSAIFTLAFAVSTCSSLDLSSQRLLCWAYAGSYGITAGSYVSLLPAALVEQFGVEQLPDMNGSIYMIRGLGMLFGASLGAHLVVPENGDLKADSFGALWFYVAACFTSATVAVLYSRCCSSFELG